MGQTFKSCYFSKLKLYGAGGTSVYCNDYLCVLMHHYKTHQQNSIFTQHAAHPSQFNYQEQNIYVAFPLRRSSSTPPAFFAFPLGVLPGTHYFSS